MRHKILIVADSESEALSLRDILCREAAAIWSTMYQPHAIKIFMDEHPDILILSFSDTDAAEYFLLMLIRSYDKFLAVSAQVLLLCDRQQELQLLARCVGGWSDACLTDRSQLDPVNLKLLVRQAFNRRIFMARKRQRERQLAPQSILVVEDNDMYRDMLQHIVRAACYEVMAAKDGFQALSLLRNWSPSLILLDVVMPGIDGISVLKQIRSSARLRALPVIVLTGMVEQEVFDDAVKYNAAVLDKPADKVTLLRKIEGCLRTSIGLPMPPALVGEECSDRSDANRIVSLVPLYGAGGGLE